MALRPSVAFPGLHDGNGPQNARMNLRSRFERAPGPNADPLSRRDEALAFSDETSWVRPAWFDQVVVVLLEPTDAVNIGGVVRAMANTGFTRLRLVNPLAPFEPWDVVGVAHYTQHIVDATTIHPTLDDALSDVSLAVGLTGKHQRAKRNTDPLPAAQRRMAEHAAGGQLAALVLGREDRGLTNVALDRCHRVTTIPTNPAYPSLNLAQAALLTLYGLFSASGGEQQEFRPPRRKADRASGRLLEALFMELERTLEAVEFFKTRSRPGIMRSLRTALFRAELDQREASLLRAIPIGIRKYLRRRGALHADEPEVPSP